MTSGVSHGLAFLGAFGVGCMCASWTPFLTYQGGCALAVSRQGCQVLL